MASAWSGFCQDCQDLARLKVLLEPRFVKARILDANALEVSFESLAQKCLLGAAQASTPELKESMLRIATILFECTKLT